MQLNRPPEYTKEQLLKALNIGSKGWIPKVITILVCKVWHFEERLEKLESPDNTYSRPGGPNSRPFIRNDAAIQLIKDQLGIVDSLGKEIRLACDANDFEAVQYLLERAAEFRGRWGNA